MYEEAIKPIMYFAGPGGVREAHGHEGLRGHRKQTNTPLKADDTKPTHIYTCMYVCIYIYTHVYIYIYI